MSVVLASGTTVEIDAKIRGGTVSASVSSLKVEVASFKYDIGGNRGTFVGAVDRSVTDDDTNYVYLDYAGTLQINTTGFPTGKTYLPLARVVTTNGEIVSIIEERVLLASSASVAGNCSIKFPVDGGVKGGNASTGSNNAIASVMFDDVGESRNRWNIGPPQNYISGDFTFRVKCSVAGTPGSNSMRLGLKWTGFNEGGILPSSYSYSSEQTVDLSSISNDEYFFVDFTISAANFDVDLDTYAFYLYRDGDHAEDTTSLSLHTHICVLNYYGYAMAGQAGQ